jgi:16S rRNA G1207 methylase RsmC
MHRRDATSQVFHDNDIASFVNTTVPFRFRGRDFTFHLSHALFSSFAVDEGSKLLLKTIAQHVDLAGIRSILDVGCGVGVIGACVQACAPAGCTAVLQDRDALAVAFTAENCRRNGVRNAEAQCSLAFHSLQGRSFDLVVSNLPAKAGEPVLRSFFRNAAACLSPSGRAAVVIVSTLAALARDSIDAIGCEVCYAEETREYAVFHFMPKAPVVESIEERESLAPYLRTRKRFTAGGQGYDLQTVYSLPEFDTLGYATEVACQVLEGVEIPKRLLFWNPGQGHLPLAILSRARGVGAEITLAGRDRLELAISERNLVTAGGAPVRVSAAPAESALSRVLSGVQFDLIFAVPHPVPRVLWQDDMAAAARALLAPGGRLLLAGTSTEMHRFLERAAGLELVESGKHFGFRAALLTRSETL